VYFFLQIAISWNYTSIRNEFNVRIRKKTEAQNRVKKIKHYQKKVATTRTEDGHKQNTKTSTTI